MSLGKTKKRADGVIKSMKKGKEEGEDRIPNECLTIKEEKKENV